MPKQVVWLDTETGGLDPKETGIIELAAIITWPGQQKKHRIFEGMGDPRKGWEQCVLHDRALEVNGLKLEDVDMMDSFDDVIHRFNREIDKGAVIGGWNVLGFDIPFLKAAYERAGIEWRFHYHAIDMMVVAKWLDFCGSLPGNRGVGLQAMLKYLGIDGSKFGDAHRALPDVYATLAVTKELKSRFLEGSKKYSF